MALHAALFSLVNVYLSFFIFGLFTTITEWKKIKAPAVKKILYLFTFPIFMFTYVPIAVVALVRKVRWEPIKHEVVKTVDEIR